jgi:hypothetical protein
MRDDRLEVSVTFDSAKGYVATVPDLAGPIAALSLAVLRRRIEERLIGEDVDVKLVLDRATTGLFQILQACGNLKVARWNLTAIHVPKTL